MSRADLISVNLVQPSVADYRVPFIVELASMAPIRLSVWAPEVTDVRDSHQQLGSLGVRFEPSPIRKVGPFEIQTRSLRAAASADVVILGLNIRFLDILPAAVIARLRGAGVIFWGHGRTPRLARWSTLIRDSLANLGHVYVLYNETEAADLRRRRIYRGEVAVALNTVDTSAVRRAASHMAGIVRDSARIAFVSRLYSAKKVELAIRAVCRASQLRQRPIELVIVGDGPERGNLASLASTLGISHQIVWHGAVHDDARLGRILSGCAAFCMPEAAGLSAVHAMAHGLPVILNDDYRSNGPEYEILEPMSNGLVFRRGDVDDLAAQMVRLVDDGELRDRLSAGAIRTVQERGYNVASMAQSFYGAIHASWRRARRSRMRGRPNRVESA